MSSSSRAIARRTRCSSSRRRARLPTGPLPQRVPMLFDSPLRRLNAIVLAVLLTLVCAAHAEAPAKVPPSGFAALPKPQQVMLDDLEKRTFEFFLDSANAANGQVPDHWPNDNKGDYFSSIAAVGFGLTAYGVGVERGGIKRGDAVRRTLATLRFFHDAPQGDEADATGSHGFFYHFLDMQTGRRYHAAKW